MSDLRLSRECHICGKPKHVSQGWCADCQQDINIGMTGIARGADFVVVEGRVCFRLWDEFGDSVDLGPDELRATAELIEQLQAKHDKKPRASDRYS